MNILSRVLCITVVSLSVTLSSSAVARTPEPPLRALQIVEAVWKVQSLSFAYSGYATIYSCDALLDKVRAILQILGARETLRIRSWGCTDMVTHGRMDITLESPVEATPENILALTTYDSTQELVARMRNEQLTSAEDVRRFPATWKTISMSRDRQLKLGPSDCELVDQLSRDVLPRMAIRVEHDRLRCSAVFGNIGQPQLRVAALVAATGAELGMTLAKIAKIAFEKFRILLNWRSWRSWRENLLNQLPFAPAPTQSLRASSAITSGNSSGKNSFAPSIRRTPREFGSRRSR